VSIAEEPGRAWRRKHDAAEEPILTSTPRAFYATGLKDLIDLCREAGEDGTQLRAAGSHWALSHAALSDHTFIETHHPREVHAAMGATLTNVVPHCLNAAYLQRMKDRGSDEKWMLVHIEAGKRIFQLYAELDQVADINDGNTLAGRLHLEFQDPGFGGPWAFQTLGGAGGQTVVGAMTTGTHGGDFDRPPLADCVVAIHLVSDGGRHFWIEKVDPELPPLTDDGLMAAAFAAPEEFGGPSNFELIRDNDVFNSVLVSAGRFGVIYSVVLRAEPAYALLERRDLHLWQDIKQQLGDRQSPLYTDLAPTGATGDQRFLQVAVSLTTHLFFQRNLVGVTRRWLATGTDGVAGHAERIGDSEGFDAQIAAHRYSKAGRAFTYHPDDDHPERAGTPSILEKACADAGFVGGILNKVIVELQQLVNSGGSVVGTTIATVAAIAGGGILLLLAALAAVILLLKEILDGIDDDTRFGEVMETIKNELLDPEETDPAARAAGLFAWQLIYYLTFAGQQDERKFTAMSYAVMDIHDYRQRSCEAHVQSVEIFFEGTDDRLVAFIDALINFEIEQEFLGRAFVGYASLRFTQPTAALIGMQRFPLSCSVELACLKDVSGGQEMIDFAVRWASNPNNGGILHWGQYNPWGREIVERTYGTDLDTWRAALQRITRGGDTFSSTFSRRTGLEVT